MTLLTKLERKIGWMSIGHLPAYIVATQTLVYVWTMLNPGQVRFLILDPRAVFAGGEFWRLVTFIFIPPLQNWIFAFFYLYLLYIYGSALENEWGSFHFTLFYVVGVVLNLAAGVMFGSLSGAVYLNITLFLAFATIFPDFILHLFFIIPIKVKWLAFFVFAGLVYSGIVSPWHVRGAVAASLINYFLFFGKTLYDVISEEKNRIQHRRRFKGWGGEE